MNYFRFKGSCSKQSTLNICVEKEKKRTEVNGKEKRWGEGRTRKTRISKEGKGRREKEKKRRQGGE